MRNMISMGCVLVAMVAALVTVPLAWVATHVANEDGYVSFTAPLGSDRELQGAFSAYLSDYLVRQQGLPQSLQPVATLALKQASSRTANAPGFAEAWQETQRRSHRMVFGPKADQDRLTVDLGPLAEFVVGNVATGLPFELSAPGSLVLAVNDAPEQEAIEQIEATPGRSQTGGIVVAVAALGALLFARRRPTALILLGAGAVAVAAALRALSGLGVPGILDRTAAPSSFARTLQKLLADRAADSLGGWLLWIAVGGGAAIVFGLVLRVSSGRSAAQR